jgi:hypothetical protein
VASCSVDHANQAVRICGEVPWRMFEGSSGPGTALTARPPRLVWRRRALHLPGRAVVPRRFSINSPSFLLPLHFSDISCLRPRVSSTSPRLQVNRGTCRLWAILKPSPPSPSTSREPGEPSPTPGERPHPRSPMLTYPHPPSPTAVRSTNRLRLCGSISGPWSARPQWAPTAVSFVGCNA